MFPACPALRGREPDAAVCTSVDQRSGEYMPVNLNAGNPRDKYGIFVKLKLCNT